MNAIELLKADHEVVNELFEKVKASDEAQHPALFNEIKGELEVHTHIEETIFYPYLLGEGDEDLVDITKEGIEEHHQVKIFLREISELVEQSDKFEPKLTVLIEDVKHHVKEEEDDMFKMCEKQFEPEVLDELGANMEAEKKKFKKTT